MDTLRGDNRVRFTKGLFQSVDVVYEVLFALFEGVRLDSIRQIVASSRRKLTWVRYLRGPLVGVITLDLIWTYAGSERDGEMPLGQR